MVKSKLKPYLKKNLDILFVGLNPPEKSNENGHYYSSTSHFWNQLYESGLIKIKVNKCSADELVFGKNLINYNNWNYGIMDIKQNQIETSSKKVKVSNEEKYPFLKKIKKYSPKVVILMHSKVLKSFRGRGENGSGKIGKIDKINDCESIFFRVPFPSSLIKNKLKIDVYRKVKHFIKGLKNEKI